MCCLLGTAPAGAAGALGGAEAVRFPSAAVPPTAFAAARGVAADPPVVLTGRLYRATAGWGRDGAGPGLVVLPGCLGRVEPELEAQLAARFAGVGIAVLVVDSLLPRLRHPQCEWDDGQVDRVADAAGALDFLASAGGVDMARVAVLGFGRAGSAALAAVAGDGYPATLSRHRFAGAVAYYPRCEAAHGALAAPGLVVIGAEDETAPVRWCRDLPRREMAAGPGAPEYLELPGAGHGFDLVGEADPAGRVWGHPAPRYDEKADAAAAAAVIRFLRRVLD